MADDARRRSAIASLASRTPGWIKQPLLTIEAASYRLALAAATPLNHLLARRLARRFVPGRVLHMSAMVHVAFHTVRILREHGVSADYLAIGGSPWWNQADFVYRASRVPLWSVVKEMWWVWTLVCRYEIVHAHFSVTLTRTGWEWPLLRQMGRQIVVHYRGCEIRNRELNQRLHPAVNICQECDYQPRICETPVNVWRRPLAAKHGSAFLVTTPDMKDFIPSARHMPFLVTRPDQAVSPARRESASRPFRIVHATNHPGIEGSRHIRKAIESLRARGRAIELVELNGVMHDRVLAELLDADLTIGKMKMGYYANAQIESLMAGVPAITFVGPELITDELRDSGFIFATLDTLETVIEHYLTHPDALAAKRAVARDSVLRLHDNTAIARRYIALYDELRKRAVSSELARKPVGA